jgi:hypothetical protein
MQSRASRTAPTPTKILNCSGKTIATMATMISALSPSGEWWATTSTDNASRVTIRQATTTQSSLRVHCTLRNNTGKAAAAVDYDAALDSSPAAKRRVLQWLSETLVGTMTTKNQSNNVFLL